MNPVHGRGQVGQSGVFPVAGSAAQRVRLRCPGEQIRSVQTVVGGEDVFLGLGGKAVAVFVVPLPAVAVAAAPGCRLGGHHSGFHFEVFLFPFFRRAGESDPDAGERELKGMEGIAQRDFRISRDHLGHGVPPKNLDTVTDGFPAQVDEAFAGGIQPPQREREHGVHGAVPVKRLKLRGRNRGSERKGEVRPGDDDRPRRGRRGGEPGMPDPEQAQEAEHPDEPADGGNVCFGGAHRFPPCAAEYRAR